MRKFDFDHRDFLRLCPEKRDFIIRTHRMPITEEQFVSAMQSMPKHTHWSHGHKPSNSKSHYRRLVNNFGFFPGGQR